MSQILQNLASGPVPPAVATSYITDDGTAIPALNILNVNGVDAIENNVEGIFTRANPNLSNNLQVILSNRILVTATTTGAQTQSVPVLTPSNNTAVEFTTSFIGYDVANNEAAGGSQEGIARKAAGVATVVGTNDSLDEADAGLIAVDWNIIDNGADLEAQFIGVAGRTISWTAVFTYTQTP